MRDNETSLLGEFVIIAVVLGVFWLFSQSSCHTDCTQAERGEIRSSELSNRLERCNGSTWEAYKP